MLYIIITLINFLIIYFCSHFFLWNENANNYLKKEKKYKKIAPPIWVWIILCIIGFAYWFGLLIYLIFFISCFIGPMIDDDVIIDPKLSEWYKKTLISRFLNYIYQILNKKVSI